MPDLKYLVLIATVVLLGTPVAIGDSPNVEKRTWRATPRGSQSRPVEYESRPLDARAAEPLIEPGELEPPGFYDRSMPPRRLQLVNFESFVRSLPIPFTRGWRYGSRHCDDLHCDTLHSEGVHCDDLVCDCGSCTACPSSYWVRADYLVWWLEGATAPPLITTSPAGTNRLDAGVLGLPTTSILAGNEEFSDGVRSGGRIEVGRWFPDRGGLGWHFAYLGVGDDDDGAGFDSSTVPVLARPFFSIEPSSVGPNAELIALPGELEGNVSVASSTSLDALELMLRWSIARSRSRNLSLAAGYHYGSLEDQLSIRDFKRVIGTGTGLAVGTTLTENDHFETENHFHGAALGLYGSVCHLGATLDLGMNFALGNNHHTTRINGSATSSVPVVGGPNDVTTTVGGLLAQSTNIGTYEGDTFAVVPQIYVDLGYDLHPQVRALIGYRLIYWSQVARAVDQIDTGVNLSQLDPAGLNGEARPRFDLRLADFWAQGLNFGLDYRF